jgi:hypothetical protein
MIEATSSEGEQAYSLAVQETQEALAVILAIKAKAETAFAAAEEANRKANSESGYAYNAKQNAEDHAKAVAQLRGSVEADVNWLTTTKKNVEESAAFITTAKQNVDADLRSVAESKTALDALLGRAEPAAAFIEQVKEDVTAVSKRVFEDAGEVTHRRASIETGQSTVAALQLQVSEGAARVQVDATSTAARAADAQALLTSLADVTEKAKTSHDRVIAYEQTLAQLAKDFDGLHSKIEALLPGATSAGLASAFRDQKTRFTRPQQIWGIAFIVAIMGLLGLGLVGSPAFAVDGVTWETTLRHILSRLPVALPLVWLALYAGRNYMLALRLQEDYAYKEAVSTAFEGYRREMGSIVGSGEQGTPVITLAESVLRTLAQRPGRLYDGKHDDLTPLTPVAKLLKETKIAKALGIVETKEDKRA